MTSTTRSPATEDEALLKKVEAMEQEVEGLTAAIHRARTMRLLLLLAAVAFVAVAAWTFWGLAAKFSSKENLNLLAEKARQRVTGNSDQYKRQMQALVETCLPVLREAATKKLKADLPKYTALLEQERDKFVEEMETKLTDKITKQQQGMADRFKGIVQKEFPEVDSPEAINRFNDNIDLIIKGLVRKYYAEEMRRRLEGIFATWEQFPPAQKPGKGEPGLEMELVGRLEELAKYRFLHGPEQLEQPQEGTPGAPRILPPASAKQPPKATGGNAKAAPAKAAAPAKVPPAKNDAAGKAKLPPPDAKK
jgi:hypothetical protein